MASKKKKSQKTKTKHKQTWRKQKKRKKKHEKQNKTSDNHPELMMKTWVSSVLGTASNNVNRGGKCGRCRHPTIFVVLPFFLSHFFFPFSFYFLSWFFFVFFFLFCLSTAGAFSNTPSLRVEWKKAKEKWYLHGGGDRRRWGHRWGLVCVWDRALVWGRLGAKLSRRWPPAAAGAVGLRVKSWVAYSVPIGRALFSNKSWNATVAMSVANNWNGHEH